MSPLGDSSIACIDNSISHLAFTGEILAEPLLKDTLTDVIQATIKSEPENFNFDHFESNSGALSIQKVEPNEPEMSSKGKKSKVWNFYVRLEKDVAKCKACEMTIKTQKGNTTGMTRHLFRAHLDLYTQLEALKEKEIGEKSAESEEDDDFSPFKGIILKICFTSHFSCLFTLFICLFTFIS